MRVALIVLLVVAFAGCSDPSPGGTPATGTSVRSTPAPSTSAGRTAAPSTTAPQDPLSALLPATMNGAAVTKTTLNPTKSPTPRVFLKVIARLGKTPPDARLSLAYAPDATVYAMRIKGSDGSEIQQAFLTERTGAAPESGSPPKETVGGKEVIRLGKLPGTFLYASDDVFFYVEAPDEPTAAEVLKQLP